jgi:protoheme IX farnesyltransferase
LSKLPMSIPAEQLSQLAAPPQPRRALWREYLVLTKPRVVALMLFTVLVGMLLAARGPLAPTLWAGTLAGIALVAGAAAALNHLVDQRIDALMERTRARPLPRGRLANWQVALFAIVLALSGTALLLATTNALCTALTLASLLGYAGVYSLYLKHATPQNIVIGGAAGAAPPLLGWVAVSGSLDPGALLLFLIIFIWTPPHFWALAIHRRADYARAAVPMLPVLMGVPFTVRRIQAYSLALLAVSLLPWAIGLSGALYAAGALLLGLRYLWLNLRLGADAGLAMASFRFSIVYLSGIFGLLLADLWLR